MALDLQLPDKITGSQFTAPEYNIIKNALTLIDEGLQLKVGKDVTDAISNRLSSAEASLTITAQQIALKVSQTDFDALGNRISSAESSITQNAQQIALRAKQTDLNSLTGRVTSTEASLVVTNASIATKVSQTTFDTLGNRVSSAESAIVQTQNAVNIRVTNDVFNALAQRVGTAEASLTVQAGQIQAKVSQSTFDALGARVGTAESTITQQAGQIASKVSQTAFDALGTRVGSAESSITQMSSQIQSKVSQTTFDALGARVGTAESTITQQAGQIASKVSQSTFDALGTRVTNAESSITQNANNIALKVSATDYTGAVIASLINQSPSTVKILAKNINLEGAVTASTFASGRIKINVNPNGDLEVFHVNGILGIRMGTDSTGHAILQGFNDAGQKMWDLDTITANGGVQYVTTVPDSSVGMQGTKVLNYSGNPPSSGDESSMITAVRALFVYATDPAGYQGYTHVPQIVSINNQSFNNMTKFTAGVPATNAALNGYHTGTGSGGAFVADGWYVFDGYVGQKLHATDYDSTNGPQMMYVGLIGIVNGQQVAYRTLGVSV